MDGRSFGEILRTTRERKGLDLNATARRLRIRPDILRAIENGNFAAMPPRGYARNMVNGYARYLGLNATEITGMFLDELRAYQSGLAGERPARATGFDMSDAPSNTRIPHRGSNNSAREHISEGNYEIGARRQYTDRDDYGRVSDYEHKGSRGVGQRTAGSPQYQHDADTPRRGVTGRGHAKGSIGISHAIDHAGTIQDRTRRVRSGSIPEGHGSLTNLYSGPQRGGFQNSRLRFIIAAFVILVVVIVICVLLFGSRASQNNQTVPNVPVTGLDDSSSAQTETKAVEVAPTKFTFAYTVDAGTSAWIEVYVDGTAQVAETVTGPSTKSFDCTGSLEFICATTNGVSITQDGTPLTMTPNSYGVVDTTINFSDVLAAWKTAHPNAATSSASTTTQTSGTTTGGASGSTGTTTGAAG